MKQNLYIKSLNMILGLFVVLLMWTVNASADLTNTWEFTNQASYYIDPLDADFVEVDPTPPGYAQLKLQAEHKYHVTRPVYTNGSTYSNVRMGPDVSVVLKKSGLNYDVSGQFLTPVIDGGLGNVWQTLNVKTYNRTFEYFNSIAEVGSGVSGLVGLWHMNNNWDDALGFNNGVNSGASFLTNAKFGTHSGDFNGVADHLTINSDLGLSGQFSISMWLYARNLKKYIVIYPLSTADSFGSVYFGLRVGGSFENLSRGITRNSIGFVMNNYASSTASNTYANVKDENVWHHVVVTYDNTASQMTHIYKDGVDMPLEYQMAAGSLPAGGYMEFGRRVDGNFGWDGLIDEVAIFDYAISAADVFALYYSGNSAVRFQVRSDAVANNVQTAQWTGPDLSSNTFYFGDSSVLSSGGGFNISNQYMQCKGEILASPDRKETPFMHSLQLYGTQKSYVDYTLQDFSAYSLGNNLTFTPDWTDWAYLGLAKQANGGYYTNGTYTSTVFTNVAGPVAWNKLYWSIGGELQNNISGLTGLWHLNGSWADASGHSYNGTATPAVSSTGKAKIGSGASVFDGLSASVNIGNIGTNQTVEFWINDENPTDAIMSLGGGKAITISNGGVTTVGITNTIPAIFVNGVRDGTKLVNGWNYVVVSSDVGLLFNNVVVGLVGGDYMDGILDEVAIYDRVLEYAEMREHFVGGRLGIGGETKFQVRSSNDPTFTGVPFEGSGGATNAYYNDPAGSSLFGMNGQYFQYKAFLDGDGIATPAIGSVEIKYDSETKSFLDDTATEFYNGTFADTVWYGDDINLLDMAGTGPLNIDGSADASLLGLWHLDESTWPAGASVKDSARGRHGTPSGNASPYIPPHIGSHCGVFSAPSDYVTLQAIVGADLLGTNNFSVSAWVKTSSTNRATVISSYAGGAYWGLYVNADGASKSLGKSTFTVSDGGSSFSAVSWRTDLNDSRWHNLVGVRAGRYIHLYMDGDRVGTTSIGSLGSVGSGTPFLARNGTDTNYPFIGYIDEVSIFKRALPAGEIGQLAAAGQRVTDVGVYESPVMDAGQPSIWETLAWSTESPHGRPLSELDASIIGLWHLDASSGGIVDASGTQADGSTTGVAYGSLGRFGRCLNFNSANNNVSIPDSASMDQNYFSVEAWIYPRLINNRVIFDKRDAVNDGYVIGLDAQGRPYFSLNASTANDWEVLRAEQWNHIAATYDGLFLRLYVNGHPKAKTSASGLVPNTVGSALIGLDYASNGDFDGLIDEVALHDRALLPGEVLDHYRSGAVTLKFQARAWDPGPQGGFVGPGGSNSTYFTAWYGDDMKGDVPLGRYFQYKAYLGTEDHKLPPKLQGIKVDVSSYPNINPSVEPTAGSSYPFNGELLAFRHTISNADPTATVKYQISGDAGGSPTWYYLDQTGTNPVWAVAPAVTNYYPNYVTDRLDINNNISTFFDQLYSKTGGQFRFRAFLHSEGDFPIKVDNVEVDASEGRVVVTAPNGNEVGTKAWVVGAPQNITWDWAGNVSDNLIIDLYDQSGSNFVANLGAGVTNSGVYKTVISEVPGNNYRIRIRDGNDPTIEDWSDGDFSLIYNLHMTDPDGGERWYVGHTNTPAWDSPKSGVQNLQGPVSLWFSNNGGTNWFEITSVASRPTNVSGNNAYTWITPTNNANYISEDALMGISTPGAADPIAAFYGDVSDSNLVMAGVAVTYPVAGDAVQMGQPVDILYKAAGVGVNGMTVDFFNGSSWTNLSTNVVTVPGTNSFQTTLNAPNPTEGARLKFTANDDPLVWTLSDEFILADIHIVSPIGGTEAVRDQWQIGTTNTIQWTSGGAGASVDIDYSTDSTNWVPIQVGYTNINSVTNVITNSAPPWVQQGPPSSNAYIRITSVEKAGLFSIAGPFDISGVQVTLPNGAEVWEFAGTNEVNWLYRAAGAQVALEAAYVSSPTSNDWKTLISPASIFNGRWDITPDMVERPSTVAKVRIRALSPPSGVPMEDESDATYTIKGISVTYPTNNAIYTMNSNIVNGIQWFSARTEDATAEIRYSSDGVTYNDIISFSGIPFYGNVDADPSWNHPTWAVSGTLLPSKNARIKVIAGAYQAVSDPFTLRGIRITHPMAGDILDIGANETVSWTSGLTLNSGAYVTNTVSTTGLAGPYANHGFGDAKFVLNNGTVWSPVDPDIDPTTNAIIKMAVTTPQDADVVVYSDPFTLRGVKIKSPSTGSNWVLGATEDISFLSAGMGAGARADVLYSPDGVNFDTVNPVASGVLVSNGINTLSWAIENSIALTRTPSSNAVIRVVVDNTHTNDSKPFVMNGIKITSPKGSDVWAVSDGTNVIKWTSVGTLNSYNVSFTVWGGVPFTQVITPVASGSSYNWNMTSNAIGSNVTINITDGSYSNVSEYFEIVDQPSIKIVSPAAGEFWKVSETNTIEWVRGGAMSNDFWLAYSAYPFTITNTLNVGSFPLVDGKFSYEWKPIPNLLGQMRIVVTNRNNVDIKDSFDGFKVAAKFDISPFSGDLYALGPKSVNWVTRGSLTSGLDLYYSTDPLRATNSWNLINATPFTTIANGQPSAYLWTVADVRTPTVYLRIQDHTYSNTMFNASIPGPYNDLGPFEIKYYRVVWQVYDTETTQHLQHVSMSDNLGYAKSDLQSPIEHYYPYGLWNTVFYAQYFHDKAVLDWDSSVIKTNVVFMDRAQVEPEPHVLANFSYDVSNRTFAVHSWIERSGQIQPDPTSATIELYDSSGTKVDTLLASSHDINGVFWMTWDVNTTETKLGLPLGTFTSSDIFFAKVIVKYSGTDYTAGLTFALRMAASDETVAAVQSLLSIATSNILAGVSVVDSNVLGVASTVSSINSNLSTVITDVGTVTNMLTGVASDVASVTNDISQISTNIAILTPSITNMASQMTNVVDDTMDNLASILMRSSRVVYGTTNNVMYKTRRGYALGQVTLTVSNATQGLVAGPINMPEIYSGMGIYQYDNLVADWGTNSYVVTCVDPQARDSMVLEVAGDSIDTVSPMIVALSNDLNNVAAQIDGVSNMVTSIAGADLTPVIDGIDEVKAAVQGIVSKPGASIDLSALTRIEAQLGTLSSGDSTFLGKLSSIESQLNKLDDLGLSVDVASRNVQSAKTQASSAASGVEDLKTLIEQGGDTDTMIASLEDIRRSMIVAQESMKDIPKAARLGDLYDQLQNMASSMEKLAASNGFDFLVGMGTEGEESGVGGADTDSIKKLDGRMESIQGDMDFMKQLMDEMRYKPVVDEELMGSQ